MTPVALFVAVAGTMCAPVPAVPKAERDLAALERKLHGLWVGQGPCDGQLVLHADGTYERRKHGPAGNDSAGTWTVRWDALPPTLVLSCTTSDDADHVGRVLEVKLVRLDDAALTFQYQSQPPARFVRLGK